MNEGEGQERGSERSKMLVSVTRPNTPTFEKFDVEAPSDEKPRPTWGKGIEFLMSCISLSVGIGNIWRFPYVAYKNGGGAFLIPYFIVLFFIGKPFYYLEMILGQFTSRGSMKAVEVVPFMKGIGWGQQVASAFVTTYYGALIAITFSYFISSCVSFTSTLPWSLCPNSTSNLTIPCNDAASNIILNQTESGVKVLSSAEIYMNNEVLHTDTDMTNGIGMPDLKLTLCLLAAWICIFISIIKGVKTSGKLSYVFAFCPYLILTMLLIRSSTLAGAMDGILFFITPDFARIFDPSVWYAAIVQSFFSLTIGMGCIIMFSSYNKFERNIYRDSMIVSVMDTFTSILGGLTIFSVLGNLAYNRKQKIEDVVQEGAALAFISYPEAISKIGVNLENAWYWPQIMAVLFFFMLFVLGVGSAVGLLSNMTTNLKDFFPKVKQWQLAGICSICCFTFGLVYMTPPGLYIIGLVDHFACGFLVFFLASIELIGIVWIYGLENICLDIEFMLRRKVTPFWRITWFIVIPCFMILINLLLAINMKKEIPTISKEIDFPLYALTFGWAIVIFGILQIVTCAAWTVYKKSKTEKAFSVSKLLFEPNPKWGPKDGATRARWRIFKDEMNCRRQAIISRENHSKWQQLYWTLLGKYNP